MSWEQALCITQLNSYYFIKASETSLSFCTRRNGNTAPDNSLVVFQEHVVVEAVLDGGAVAEAASVHPLHGFAHDVGAGVPVNLERARKRGPVSEAAAQCVPED